MEFDAFSENWISDQPDFFGLNATNKNTNEPLPLSKTRTKKKYPSSLSGAVLAENDFSYRILSPNMEDFSVLMAPTPEENEKDLNEIDWDQLNIDFSSLQNESIKLPQEDHVQQGKRVISGTAIFGFQNHDKSFQLPTADLTSRNLDGPILDANSIDQNDVNKLIKQQEELILALDQQKEANKKLEAALSKIQRKQYGDISPDLKKNNLMFASYNNENTLNDVEQLFNISTDELLESPTKKQKRNSQNNSQEAVPSNYRKSSSTIRKMGSLFEELNVGMKKDLNSNTSMLHKSNSNIVTYHNHLISPALSNQFSPRNANMELSESISGELIEEPSIRRPSNSIVLGLGLHSDKTSSVNVMTTIPGSTSNSPIKSSSPIKQSNDVNNKELTYMKKFSLNTKINLSPKDSSNTKEISKSPVISNSEMRGSVNSSPSPILKSQGQFEGKAPQFQLNLINTNGPDNMSPLKITRKLTTLPRGSIDVYVKELENKHFECLYPGCGKNFKRRYNVRSHIQTHLEDRPYRCDFRGCDKGFVRNHDLIRHKKCHSEKSYACPCGKKFNREDALIVHRCRMICIGGKKYDNVIIKRSPRKRGRPRKNESSQTAENKDSPTNSSNRSSDDDNNKKEIQGKLNFEDNNNAFLSNPSDFNIASTLLMSSEGIVDIEDAGSHGYGNTDFQFDL